MKLIGLVGSNSKKSTNRMLLQYMQKHFTEGVEIKLIEIKEFPMFNKPASMKLPDVIQEISEEIKLSDGVIIATPEYDHAIPAVLMNALAWLSYGIDPFLNKPVMITGASYGTLGSSRAQLQLRQILDAPELKANVMPGSEFLLAHSLQAFNEAGDLSDIEVAKNLEKLFKSFQLFVKMVANFSSAKEFILEDTENKESLNK